MQIPNYRNKFDSLRKSPAYCVYPVPKEGTSATSLTLGRVAVDAAASSRALGARASDAFAYGEVVWS